MHFAAHAGGNLPVAAAVSNHVQIAVIADVVDKPRNLIGMSLNDHFVIVTRVDDTHCRSIGVGKLLVDIWAQVVQPNLLATVFKAGGANVVQIGLQEFNRFFAHSYECRQFRDSAGIGFSTLYAPIGGL